MADIAEVHTQLYCCSIYIANCPTCNAPCCLSEPHDGAPLTCICGTLGRIVYDHDTGNEYCAKWYVHSDRDRPMTRAVTLGGGREDGDPK